MASNMPRHTPQPQRGAALVTSLLLLIVLTVIGVTVLQVSRMQERMAGNTRDVSTGFEAAEAALRDGEEQIRLQASQPATCSAAPCAFWAKSTFTPGVLGDVATLTGTWWMDNGTPFADQSGNPMTPAATGVSENPQYVIEEIAFVRTDGQVEIGDEPAPGREFYQVTAHSTGASGLANVVLQSTYARKF